MVDWNILGFVVFPYLSLATFVVGHAYRHVTDPFHWNARSSELLEKEGLKTASVLFHYGIVLTFVGHFVGLLIPQAVYDAVGINSEMHTHIAIFLGILFGLAAVVGNVLLLSRRITRKRVRVTSTAGDFVTSILLLFVIGAGTYNVFFGHFHVLDTVAPWIRSIVTLAPKPELLDTVPILYKVHILGAFALFAFSPFSRLIHIWSLPVPYALRSPLSFRRHSADHIDNRIAES